MSLAKEGRVYPMPRTPNVGILGNPCGVLIAGSSVDVLNEYIGENTGNLLFQHAVWKRVKNPKLNFRMGIDFDVDYFRDNIDVLCIPAANQINPMWDLDAWADLVEYIDKPVVIAGLGAQAAIGEVAEIRLGPGTRRFLEGLHKRAIFIGVRGEETRQFLVGIGFSNVVVTGCPSNFINDHISGENIVRKLEAFLAKNEPAVNYVFGTMEDISREYERSLFQMWRGNPGKIIYQTDRRMMDLVLNGVQRADFAPDIEWQQRYLAADLSPGSFTELLRSRGTFFFDPLSWIDTSSRADLTIGLRIHGAVAAIQGHSLGVCVAFDSRTLELASTMGYPHVLAKDIQKISSLHELDSILRFDAEEFDEKRESLRENLKLVMNQHGVIADF
jgi:hypothetical protein